MRDLIYNKINEYDSKLKEFEVSYSNRSLNLQELITLYQGRNRMTKDENIKELTTNIVNCLIMLKERSIEYIKFVVVRKKKISRLFFFNEEYTEIFFDFEFPKSDDFQV